VDWRPLGLQWVSNGDVNYNREVLFYGPDSITDNVFTNLNNGTFSASSTTKTGWPIPLVGNFHGTNNYSEILWWTPDSGSSLWRKDNNGNLITSTAYTELDGEPSEPLDLGVKVLTGSFGLGAASKTQMLWYSSCWGYVTRGTGTSGFESYIVDMNYLVTDCDQDRQIPLLGDFDGDTRGDIFWYGPGSVPDRLVLNRDVDLYESYSNYDTSPHDLPVNGHYKPLVGDFNGDYKSDIFWYQPGTGFDSIWIFTGPGSYDPYPVTVNGDYSPISGDFNNDGCADIVWYDPSNDRVFVWRSDCDGTFTSDPTHTVPDGAYPVGYGIGY
jgi:hypothetical protein